MTRLPRATHFGLAHEGSPRALTILSTEKGEPQPFAHRDPFDVTRVVAGGSSAEHRVRLLRRGFLRMAHRGRRWSRASRRRGRGSSATECRGPPRRLWTLVRFPFATVRQRPERAERVLDARPWSAEDGWRLAAGNVEATMRWENNEPTYALATSRVHNRSGGSYRPLGTEGYE